jgi:hypothetical protein
LEVLFLFFYFLFFIHISSSWDEIRLHPKIQLSTTFNLESGEEKELEEEE